MKTKTPLKELYQQTTGSHIDRWTRFKNEVMKGCRVTEATFNNWMRGFSEPRKKDCDTIDQIAVVMFGKMPYIEREEAAQPEEVQ